MENDANLKNDFYNESMKEEDNKKWTAEMNWILIDQIYKRGAFLNRDYYQEFITSLSKLEQQTNHLKSIDEKFDDISNYLWDISNPKYPNFYQKYFQKYPKVDGKNLRQYYKQYRKPILIDLFGLPRMVTLPIGGKGCDVTDKKLERALAYSKAMVVVLEGDARTKITYKSTTNQKHDWYVCMSMNSSTKII
jgi:hypothetical protein